MKTPLYLVVASLWAVLPSPGRAQLTEIAHTIKPGRMLFEIDGLRLSVDRDGGEKLRALGIASTVVSAGLTSTVDLQVGVDLFLRETVDSAGRREARSGVGDVSLRTKWAFWQDEGGAAAIIPYVRVPTGSGAVGSEAVEGGFILPWERSLGAGLMAGAMLQWDVLRNPDDNGYDSAWLVTSYLQRNLTRALAVYGEAAVDAASSGGSSWKGTLGAGLVWKLNSHLEFDYELLRGLNRQATDWTHVLRAKWKW
jgi:hypothetical protein